MFDQLVTELRAARVEFDALGRNVRSPIVRSLRAVLSFLTNIKVVDADGLQVPLGHLFAAILALEDGLVLQLLKPVAVNGRPRAGLVYDTVKALTVHFVDLLCAI